MTQGEYEEYVMSQPHLMDYDIINKERNFMAKKLKEVLGSVSFWMSVIGAVVLILGQYEIIPMMAAEIIAGWCGFGVVKRTVDKFV